MSEKIVAPRGFFPIHFSDLSSEDDSGEGFSDFRLMFMRTTEVLLFGPVELHLRRLNGSIAVVKGTEVYNGSQTLFCLEPVEFFCAVFETCAASSPNSQFEAHEETVRVVASETVRVVAYDSK